MFFLVFLTILSIFLIVILVFLSICSCYSCTWCVWSPIVVSYAGSRQEVLAKDAKTRTTTRTDMVRPWHMLLSRHACFETLWTMWNMYPSLYPRSILGDLAFREADQTGANRAFTVRTSNPLGRDPSVFGVPCLVVQPHPENGCCVNVPCPGSAPNKHVSKPSTDVQERWCGAS